MDEIRDIGCAIFFIVVICMCIGSCMAACDAITHKMKNDNNCNCPHTQNKD
jgi:hypothetical protein